MIEKSILKVEQVKYQDFEPICSCDECIFKRPLREWCRKLAVPLPEGRRCNRSIRKTSSKKSWSVGKLGFYGDIGVEKNEKAKGKWYLL